MRLTLRVILVLMLLAGFQASFAQDRVVSGKVTSADDGAEIPGVNIIIKGTTTGVTTDFNGEYKITIPSENSVLVYSFIGFISQEVTVGAQSVIDVALISDVTQLEEIVVSGSAVGKSKKTLSFSVGSIDEELMNAVPSPSLGNGLQGKVAGLRVNNVSGQPGAGAFFQIRGANSISNGQQPLIILDGIFLNGSTLADINPEDVERVEVLKGSAAASLYGSQAANGVIQIFTKRGSGLDKGSTQVVYRGEFGTSKEHDRYDINNFTNLTVDGTVDPIGRPVLGPPSADNIHNTPLPNLQDYQDQVLFQNGTYQSHYVAVQGRGENTNFGASVQRLEDEGVIQGTDGYTRNAFRLNIDHRISDKLDISASAGYSTSDQDLLDVFANGPGSYISSALFLTPIFDLNTPNEEDGSDFNFDIDNTGLGTSNPLYNINNVDQDVERTRIQGNFQINYEITDWLSANVSAAFDRSDNRYEQFVNRGFLDNLNIPGLFGTLVLVGTAPTDAAGNVVFTSNGGGIHRSNRVINSVITRFNLVAQKSFGDWNVAARASYLYENFTNDYNDVRGENLAVAGIRGLDNVVNVAGAKTVFTASEQQEYVASSYFVIADVDYQQKYIFSGLYRYEGSSLFGPDERWASYYRGSGAWRITEDFTIPGFQELKLRASIGTAGLRPLFEQRFETFELIDGTPQKATLGNEALKPAQSREIEVGFDANFLNAFGFEFNYSTVTTEDQILLVPLPGYTGFADGQWRNAGTIEAETIELSLNTNFSELLNLGDFKWDLGITFDRTTQDITELNVPAYNTGPGTQQSTLFLIDEGIPFGTMVGEVFATSLSQLEGQVNTGSPGQAAADGSPVDPSLYEINEAGYVVLSSDRAAGAEVPYKLRDNAGNPIVEQIGDINPDFRMGFANTFAYKGFTLFTLFDWKKGGDIYNMSKHWLYRDDRHADVSRFRDVPSHPAGGIADNFYGSNGLYNVLVSNNHFVEDGSFFMLRELSLSYDFNQTQLSNIFNGFIKGIRLSVVGRNVFTITDYTGFHPDITSTPTGENTLTNRVNNTPGSRAQNPGGDPSVFMVDNFNYPVTKSITGSIKLTF